MVIYTQQPMNCLCVSVRCDWKAWGNTTAREQFACQCQVWLESMGKYNTPWTLFGGGNTHNSPWTLFRGGTHTAAHEPYPEGEIHTTAHEPYPEGETHTAAHEPYPEEETHTAAHEPDLEGETNTAAHEPYPEGPWQLHKGTSEWYWIWDVTFFKIFYL